MHLKPDQQPTERCESDYRQGLAIAFAALCLVLAAAGLDAADSFSEDARLLAGLRERRLYSLAAAHCEQHLSNSQLAPARRAELTAELMRVLGQQALDAPPDQRSQYWNRAHELASDFLMQYADAPRGQLVAVQDALLWRSEGEALYDQARVARQGEPGYAEALEALRRAAAGFAECDKRLESMLVASSPNRAAGENDELSHDELFALRSHVLLERARVDRLRGHCYPPGSDDRIAGATDALTQLANVLTLVPADDPLAWEARLEQLIAQRQIQGLQQENVQQLLTQLDPNKAPAELQGRVRAELVRTALASGQLGRALQLSEPPLPARQAGAADLDLARLEALVANWQHLAGQQHEQAAEWRQRAVRQAEAIERAHGSYWARRADQALLDAARGSRDSGDLEILRRQADDLYLRGELAAAVAAYDQAADAAEAAGNLEEAFLCSYRAALVEQKRNRQRESLRRLQQLALAHPQLSGAAPAHFEAIKSAARLARDDEQHLATFASLLDEHISAWPSAPTSNTVRVWLANLHSSRGQHRQACDLYAAVPPDSEQAAAAIEGLERSWTNVLASAADRSQAERLALLEQALASLQAYRTASPGSVTAAVRGTAALAAARLVLHNAPERAVEASQWLEAALQMHQPQNDPSETEDPADAWRASAEAWLFVALALQPARRAEAERLLADLAQTTPEQLLEIVELLAGAVDDNTPAALRAELGRLQLSALDQMPNTLAGPLRLRAQRLRGAALAAAGDRPAAIALLEQLAAEQPRDGALQLQLARLLAAANDTASLERALAQWALVARHTPPNTDDWYLAKYEVAGLLARLNRRAEAARLLQYVQLTSPVNNTPWKDRYARKIEELGGTRD